MIRYTAIIVIKNDPSYLDRSLAAINDFVDEILIGTIDVPDPLVTKLKKNKKTRVIPLDSSIPFADLVKEQLKKQAKGQYIFYVDPDEIFPKKTLQFLRDNSDKYDYFWIPRKNIIFGKWIEHSRWWPDYQLRFFKKDSVIWPPKIHPIPETKGLGINLPEKEELAILHYNYDNLSQYFEKSLRYAKSEAKKAVVENKKITISETFKRGLNEFFSRYFSGDGFKDGTHGFVLAFLQMFYYFLIYVFYWEEKKYANPEEAKNPGEIQNFFANGLKESNYWLINKKLLYNIDKLKIKFLAKVLDLFKL